MITNKTIEPEYYEKVFNNEFRKYYYSNKVEHPGCLFSYDDGFNKYFEKMIDIELGFCAGINAKLWLELRKNYLDQKLKWQHY